MLNFHLKPVPHDEAAKLIADKAPVTREIFDRMPDEIRARAFVVTGIESHDVLQALRDRIAELPAGADWDEVKADVVAGLSPHMTLEDANRRAQILMRHHGFSAYAAAQARVQDELVEVFPYRQYISTDDFAVRPSHAALNGIVLPADHPFWEKHTPPWEWNCRCDVVELTEIDAEEEKARDKRRNPENRRVLEGSALIQLENGQLNRGPTMNVDVRTPKERGGNYENNVRNLNLPYDEIQKRWDDQTRDDFEEWAAETEIGEAGTVMDWLRGGAAAAGAAGGQRVVRRLADLAGDGRARVSAAELAALVAAEPEHEISRTLAKWGDDEEEFIRLIRGEVAEAEKWQAEMGRVLARMDGVEGEPVLYRGWKFGSAEEREAFLEAMVVDDVFTQRRVGMSTTFRREVAERGDFMEGDGGMLWVIEGNRSARDMRPVFETLGVKSAQVREEEAIVPGGVRFRRVNPTAEMQVIRDQDGQAREVAVFYFQEENRDE